MRFILVSMVLAAASSYVIAQDDCYADCADGLAPVNDIDPALREPAPSFTAVLFDPKTSVVETRSLDDLVGERPVVLAFGSYTAMGLRSQFESLVRFRERWKREADVYVVYGREAFPTESRWPAPVPDERPVSDPKTLDARLELVSRFAREIGDQIPFLVDDVANRAMTAYDAYPFRVFAISPDGTIAVTSDKGAAGFASTLERIDIWLAGLRRSTEGL